LRRIIIGFISFSTWVVPAAGQELEPGAYSISRVGVNIVVVANNFSGGDVSFDPTLPVEEAEAKLNTTVFDYVRTLDFLGRSANVGVALPYTR